MARVVRGTLKPAGDVKSKLCSVSLKEGETIGRGLAMALAGHLTAEAGVAEWVGRYDALTELDRTEAWFRLGERSETSCVGQDWRVAQFCSHYATYPGLSSPSLPSPSLLTLASLVFQTDA